MHTARDGLYQGALWSEKQVIIGTDDEVFTCQLQEYRAAFQEQRDAAQLKVDAREEDQQRQLGELMGHLKTTYTTCIDDLGDNSRMAALWERDQGMTPGQSDPNAGANSPLTGTIPAVSCIIQLANTCSPLMACALCRSGTAAVAPRSSQAGQQGQALGLRRRQGGSGSPARRSLPRRGSSGCRSRHTQAIGIQ